jgi:hypothetical protein
MAGPSFDPSAGRNVIIERSSDRAQRGEPFDQTDEQTEAAAVAQQFVTSLG